MAFLEVAEQIVIKADQTTREKSLKPLAVVAVEFAGQIPQVGA